jgi:hypothetical protein
MPSNTVHAHKSTLLCWSATPGITRMGADIVVLNGFSQPPTWLCWFALLSTVQGLAVMLRKQTIAVEQCAGCRSGRGQQSRGEVGGAATDGPCRGCPRSTDVGAAAAGGAAAHVRCYCGGEQEPSQRRPPDTVLTGDCWLLVREFQRAGYFRLGITLEIHTVA